MTPIAKLVDETAGRHTAVGKVLPWPLALAHKGILFSHRMWKWYCMGRQYKEPNNLFQLMMGHSLDFTLGSNKVVRIAAHCVMVATKILECIEAQAKLLRSWNKLVKQLKTSNLFFNKTKWRTLNCKLSPSISFHWSDKWKRVKGNIKKIIKLTHKIFQRLFALSMKTMDAIECFSFAPEVQRTSVQQVFINTSKWIDTLATNTPALILGLKKNRKVIEHILLKTGNHIKFEGLLGSLETSADKVEKANCFIKTLNQATGHFFLHIGKEALFGTADLLAQAHHIPNWLLPELYPEIHSQLEKLKGQPRFVEKSTVTRPSLRKRLNQEQSTYENVQQTKFEEEIFRKYNYQDISKNKIGELPLPPARKRY